MGLWPWSKSKQPRKATAMVVRAKFDAAQTTAENRNHWAAADGLSADAAAKPDVRRTVRNRARYEVANNSYARGIVLTLANDVIGSGPRLQMLLGEAGDAGANQAVEQAFAAWAKAVDLAGKLRTVRTTRAQDGEAFILLFSNPNLPTEGGFGFFAPDDDSRPLSTGYQAGMTEMTCPAPRSGQFTCIIRPSGVAPSPILQMAGMWPAMFALITPAADASATNQRAASATTRADS